MRKMFQCHLIVAETGPESHVYDSEKTQIADFKIPFLPSLNRLNKCYRAIKCCKFFSLIFPEDLLRPDNRLLDRLPVLVTLEHFYFFFPD